MKYRNEYTAINSCSVKIGAGKKSYRPSASLEEYIEREFKINLHDVISNSGKSVCLKSFALN
jgi:hypothetical protein